MLHILHSADPGDPGAQNGVLIALNKSLVKTANILMQDLMEGRVQMVGIPLNGEDTL